MKSRCLQSFQMNWIGSLRPIFNDDFKTIMKCSWIMLFPGHHHHPGSGGGMVNPITSCVVMIILSCNRQNSQRFMSNLKIAGKYLCLFFGFERRMTRVLMHFNLFFFNVCLSLNSINLWLNLNLNFQSQLPQKRESLKAPKRHPSYASVIHSLSLE